MAAVVERIEETTVGDLAGARVAVGTVVLAGRYPLPDGSEGQGVAAVLAFADDSSVWVGIGSEIEAGGARWRVIDCTKQRGAPGEVTLEQVGPA